MGCSTWSTSPHAVYIDSMHRISPNSVIANCFVDHSFQVQSNAKLRNGRIAIQSLKFSQPFFLIDPAKFVIHTLLKEYDEDFKAICQHIA